MPTEQSLSVQNDPEIQLLLSNAGAGTPEFVVTTHIATIWKVETVHGSAALKVYPDHGMSNEAAGFQMLRNWNGNGAARLFDLRGRAALIE